MPAPGAKHVLTARKGGVVMRVTVTPNPTPRTGAWPERLGILSQRDDTSVSNDESVSRDRWRTIMFRSPSGVASVTMSLHAEVERSDAPMDDGRKRELRGQWDSLFNEASLCFDTLTLFAATNAPPGLTGDDPATNPQARPDAWWQARTRELNTRYNTLAKKGEAKVLFLGDSITQGWEGAGTEAWAGVLAPMGAVNLGLGGDRTQHVLHRIMREHIVPIGKPKKGDAPAPPRAAVLLIGTNNLNSDTPAQVAAGIEACCRALHAKLPTTRLVVLAILPRAEAGSELRRKVAETNALLPGVIERLRGGQIEVKLVDVGGLFVLPDGSISREVMPDLLHLSGTAYAKLAAALKSELEEAAKMEPKEPQAKQPTEPVNEPSKEP